MMGDEVENRILDAKIRFWKRKLETHKQEMEHAERTIALLEARRKPQDE